MKCPKCNSEATTYNKDKIPVCSRHKTAKVKAPTCPDCKLPMMIRTGKYGAFWGCIAFPSCSGIKKL